MRLFYSILSTALPKVERREARHAPPPLARPCVAWAWRGPVSVRLYTVAHWRAAGGRGNFGLEIGQVVGFASPSRGDAVRSIYVGNVL